MAENSNIEWTDHTFNPWIGCQKVGPGCDGCYAEAMMDTRLHKVQWGPGMKRIHTSGATWKAPIKWNSAHAEFFEKHGRRQRVFCASLADVFDNAVDTQWRADLFQLIEATPNLDWLLLTKRIGNVASMVPEATDLIDYGGGWQSMWGQGEWPNNVWLGATICNQQEADRDIPKLLKIPATKRFLSMEPLLGAVDISKWLDPFTCADCCYHGSESDAGPDTCYGCGELFGDGNNCQNCGKDDQFAKRTCPSCGSSRSYERDHGFKFDSERKLIDWVIVGGESGPDSRPLYPAWPLDLRDQCREAGVAFHFKQWGEWVPMMGHAEGVPVHGPKFIHSDGTIMGRAGKKAAGRLLDGRTWDQFPETRR